MNKAIIIGRLTRDPEMRTTTSGINSTTFTVAVSRNYANQNGERETDFINCVAWRKQAERCVQRIPRRRCGKNAACARVDVEKRELQADPFKVWHDSRRQRNAG